MTQLCCSGRYVGYECFNHKDINEPRMRPQEDMQRHRGLISRENRRKKVLEYISGLVEIEKRFDPGQDVLQGRFYRYEWKSIDGEWKDGRFIKWLRTLT